MSETNPWAWYSDPDVLGLERERIFRSAWHYVATPAGCGRPSSYFACDTRRTAGTSSPATGTASSARSSTSAVTAAP